MRGAGPRVSDRTADASKSDDPVPEFHCGRLGLVQQFGVSCVDRARFCSCSEGARLLAWPFPRAGDEEEEGRVISLACTACSNGCFPRRLGFIALVWRGRSGAQDIRPCHAGFQNPVEIQSGLNFIIWSVFTEFIQIHRKISKIQSQNLDLTESEFEHCSCPCQWMPCIARHDQIAPGEAAM
jgi:hypothetical protein